MCHHPQQAVENIVLANYSTSECTMLPQPSEKGLLFICGCVGEPECNDKLIFDKGAHGKDPISVSFASGRGTLWMLH